MPDEILFRLQQVSVPVREWDLPGPTRRKVACVLCGQVVRDSKQVHTAQGPMCVPCANGGYLKPLRTISVAEALREIEKLS